MDTVNSLLGQIGEQFGRGFLLAGVAPAIVLILGIHWAVSGDFDVTELIRDLLEAEGAAPRAFALGMLVIATATVLYAARTFVARAVETAPLGSAVRWFLVDSKLRARRQAETDHVEWEQRGTAASWPDRGFPGGEFVHPIVGALYQDEAAALAKAVAARRRLESATRQPGSHGAVRLTRGSPGYAVLDGLTALWVLSSRHRPPAPKPPPRAKPPAPPADERGDDPLARFLADPVGAFLAWLGLGRMTPEDVEPAKVRASEAEAKSAAARTPSTAVARIPPETQRQQTEIEAEIEAWKAVLAEPAAERFIEDVNVGARRRIQSSYQTLRGFPEANRVQPTRLGNLAAALDWETRRRYGVDMRTLWPRVWFVLSDGEREAVADARIKVESLLVLASVMVVILLVSAWVGLASLRHVGDLTLDPRAWIMIAAPVLVAVIAYQGAILAYEELADRLSALFDLHRLELLHELGYPRPKTVAEEGAYLSELQRFVRQVVPRPPDRAIEESE